MPKIRVRKGRKPYRPSPSLELAARVQAGSLTQWQNPFRRHIPPIVLPPPPERVLRYQVRVDLDRARPPIWRRLSLPGDLTLERLHGVLQAAMGWYDDHLHAFRRPADEHWRTFLTADEFDRGDRDGIPEFDVRLDQVLRTVGDRLEYVYDFGDSWKHLLRLEAVDEPQPDEDGAVRCLTGRRACPPEDVGGMYAYLAAVNHDPRCPSCGDHVDDRLPPGFDPGRFDLQLTNARLAGLTASRRPRARGPECTTDPAH